MVGDPRRSRIRGGVNDTRVPVAATNLLPSAEEATTVSKLWPGRLFDAQVAPESVEV
jgi:hypothetical protein